jgi:predicted MFS family arabinose efflux permease
MTSSRRSGSDRDFALLWFGEGVSVFGNATTSLLVPILAAVRLHAGPGWMGVLSAAAWLPWLLIGLPAGAWVDRWDPRRVMIVADVCAAAALLVVPAAAASGHLDLTQLLFATFVGGVCTVFFRTAYAKLLPRLVAPDGLELANARMMGTESAAQVAGPGLAGLITEVTSAAAGLCLDAVSFLVSASCLVRIRGGHRPDRERPAPEDGPRRLRREIRAGVELVRRDRNLRTVTVIGGLSNFGLTGYAALLVLYFVHVLGLPPGSVGIVFMLGGVGGLVGATAAARLARRVGNGRASSTLFLVAGPSALLIGLPTHRAQVWLSVLGLGLVGAAVIAGNVIRGAWRQRYVPAEVMGRVVTTMQVVNYGTMPVAGVTAGWLGAHLGVRATVLAMAGVHAAACLIGVTTRFGRAHALPSRPLRATSPTLRASA